MKLKIEYVNKEELKPYANNAKVHTAEQIDQIKTSIEEFGFNDPIAVWHDDEVIEGHGRLLAVMEMDDIQQVPVIRLDDLTDEQRRAYILVHNKLTMNTDFNDEILEVELEDIADIDMGQFGFGISPDLFENNIIEKRELSDDFIIPPFDVFDARSRRWLDRKAVWKEKIGDVGQARADAKAYDNEPLKNSGNYRQSYATLHSGVSILDPVLSEIVLKWFTPSENSSCFDCFAGDTVFGYVSSYLGHNFTGIELRQEQVDFNTERTQGLPCKYICDDGRNVADHIKVGSQDLLFSCPPYYDIEVYSDLENDASNQETYEDFYKILDTAFTNAIKCLKNNRFAVIVVGDVRDKEGAYYNFPSDIINTFKRNGLVLYNNIKLLTPLATAPIRARKQMRSRKTVHVYQEVLVFYKGDMQAIRSEFPEIEVSDESGDMEL